MGRVGTSLHALLRLSNSELCECIICSKIKLKIKAFKLNNIKKKPKQTNSGYLALPPEARLKHLIVHSLISFVGKPRSKEQVTNQANGQA